MGNGSIQSEVHTVTGRRVRRGRRGQWPQTRQRDEKSPTLKIYTTWARTLRDRNIFCTLRGGRTTAGYNAPGAFLVFWGVTCLSHPVLSRLT